MKPWDAPDDRYHRSSLVTAPAISIVMNVYNGSAFLREAIGSVLAQTWKDWELIFWDDRSTDDSAQVFRTFNDPRLRYFLAPTRTTLGPARIEAIAQARGPWLAFLDQDDIWTATKLERQLELLNSAAHADDVGLIYGRAIMFDQRGRRWAHDHRHEYAPLPEGNILRSLFEDSCFIAMSSAMVRRSAYDAVGGISRGYDYAIDYQLYLDLAHRYRALALQDPCCYYRVHGSNLSHSRPVEILGEMLRIIDSWEGRVDAELLSRQRRVYESHLAYEDLRRGRVLAGLSRLARSGSASYLLSRPFARGWRAARRKLTPTALSLPSMPNVQAW